MPEDKKSSVADFLNGISDKKEDIFQEEINTEEPVVQDTEEEKPLPFHKDPKVQRYVDKQIEKALKDRPSAEQQFRKEIIDEVNLPASFVKLVGNDTDEKKQVLKDLSDYFGSLKGEARKEFLEEMKEQERQSQEADNAAVAELDEAFENIEENYDVDLSSNSATARQLRASFIEYVRKIAPKNEDGEVSAFPDMPSAFEAFQETQRRPNANRAKELASRGMTRSTDASTELPKGRSWRDVDKFFDKLKNNN